MDRRSFQRNHPAVMVFGMALLVSLVVLGARKRGWIQGLELSALDHYAGLVRGDPMRIRVWPCSKYRSGTSRTSAATPSQTPSWPA